MFQGLGVWGFGFRESPAGPAVQQVRHRGHAGGALKRVYESVYTCIYIYIYIYITYIDDKVSDIMS